MSSVAIPGLRWCSIPVWLLIWFLVARSGVVAPTILPDLVDVGRLLFNELANGLLLRQGLVTAGRALAGFALAIPFGVVLGALIARVRWVDTLLEPITFITYPIPKIALFPILIFVFGLGTPSKIAFAFLESFYPIVAATIFAFRTIPVKLIWTAQSMGASKVCILQQILLPSALPGIFTGMRVALPVSLLVVIVAEMIGDSRGLGYYIAEASLMFQTDRVYVGIIAVGVLGSLFDRALLILRNTVVRGS